MYEEISGLLQKLDGTKKQYDIEKIKEAFLYAKELHEGQMRQSGEPYISHPVAVATILAELELDTDSICAGLLHDTLEDCGAKTCYEDLRRRFGDDVALIVEGVTKIISVRLEDKEEAHIENIRKMLLAMSKDIRVIFVKLCDRLHNMRTLDAKSDEKRRTISLETMYIYAPLAHRLGMQRIKQELEDISLRYLDPIGYGEISGEIERRYGKTHDLIEGARREIVEKLTENHIACTMEGRVKSVYSLYRKIYTQNREFDDIYDFYAVRVIVGTELECYTVLGLVHELFRSVPGRFKDYISTPKANLYRSLHTTVVGHDGVPFEVQIRTTEMHHVAEYGIAAHWKYKSGEKSREEIDEKLRWISQLIESDESSRDPDDFMHAFKTDIFHDETFVFTPRGDVISLPRGATVIDFAYAIHSAVGNKMTGAKINGSIVPIDRVPQNGDIVEILTSSATKGPSRDWLKIVKTSSAKGKIRQWFKKEKRAENIVLGREELERELRRYGRPFTEEDMEAIATRIAERVGIQGTEDFYNTIGFGGLTVSHIAGKLREEFDRRLPPPATQEEKPALRVSDRPRSFKKDSGVIVDGARGCLIKFAKCCNPLPGDEVIGFVTRGLGTSIHKCDCPNAVRGMRDDAMRARWVEAHWEDEFVSHDNEDLFEALIKVFIVDRIGILADISVALAEMRVTIMSVNTGVPSGGKGVMNLSIGCKNVSHFRSIISRLRKIDGVLDVVRGVGR
ncbi:MAG: bifunctional (p)ppGpp synthetase/guanosine-3',5'-bis(diphosphate) 3'-pyrophosphohydrolase [Clostridia bacterium]|nr:bifunctional (p)ppGpp synthetase/guanosine-3',5'-bis(diphosphate) 3'-pyrophosphohydrolase [Clostridia bacterium]